jgi:hypothetical protein
LEGKTGEALQAQLRNLGNMDRRSLLRKLTMKKNRFFSFFAIILLVASLLASCDLPLDDSNKEPDPRINPGLLILQFYGDGDKADGAVSHSFVELYNPTGNDMSLDEYSLQYSEGGAAWDKLDLSGKTIRAKSSFLVLCKKNSVGARLDLTDTAADITWPGKYFSNGQFTVCLIKNTETLSVENPFDIDGEGTKSPGYVDMAGAVNGSQPTITACEAEFGDLISKQKSARRITLDDTDNNKNDFETIDYRARDQSKNQGNNNAKVALYRPRNSAAGEWNPVTENRPSEESDHDDDPNVMPAVLLLSPSDLASGVPVIKIDTQGRYVSAVNQGNAYAPNWNFPWLTGVNYAIYDAEGELLINGATDLKGRGNSTWNLEKKPYALKLAEKSPVLGMPEHKRWALLANHYDKSLMRTEIAIKLGNIFDNMAYTPRSQAVAFYLNNQYQGAYQLIENIKLDVNRVNIEEIKKKNPQGGYILEIDARKGEVFNFTTTKGIVFCCSDPDDALDDKFTVEPYTNTTLFQKIQADVQAAEDALFSANFKDPETGYRKYLDVDSFIDWYFVNEITKNPDAVFYSSVYMYYDPVKEKYCMGPIWDFDISLGNVSNGPNGAANLTSPTGFHVKNAVYSNTGGVYNPWGGYGGTQVQGNWIYRLFEDPAFVAQVKARWAAKRAELNSLSAFIDSRAAYLDKAQTLNFIKWRFNETFSGTIHGDIRAGEGATYPGEVGYVKNFLTQRIAWLDTNIIGL